PRRRHMVPDVEKGFARRDRVPRRQATDTTVSRRGEENNKITESIPASRMVSGFFILMSLLIFIGFSCKVEIPSS
ncbi:MAG TPA: hypothetical protein VK206_13370, partial [Anaerolineales bacterium]|nr:hypothetical protein [Anaerolineales bacterium]